MEFRVTQSRDFIGDTIGDDTILINLKTGAYYSLTPRGGSVWAQVLAETTEFTTDDAPVLMAMVAEGIFESDVTPVDSDVLDSALAFMKYTEMSELLLADPIHEVDEDGWPKLR